MARQTTRRTGARKNKRNVPNGVAYIQSTFNNTIVTIADTVGDVISWSSAGASGFKGAKKVLHLQHKQPLNLLPEERWSKECVKLK